MRLASLLRSLWSNVVRRRHVEQSLSEEIQSYVDLLTEEHIRAGLSPSAARRQALIDAGGITQVKEATREAWLGDWLATTNRDVRYALRALRRSAGFTATAVIVLAIGIAGATAVFTIIKGSLLRPLPAVPEPQRLVSVERVLSNGTTSEISYPDYQDLRDRSSSLVGLAGFDGTSLPLTNGTVTEREWVSFVTPDFFTVLGVRPVAGRVFTAADSMNADAASVRVIVIGHELWQRRFGGSAAAIGSSITLNDEPFTIIGVAPPRFIGAMATHTMDAWAPIAFRNHVSPILGGMSLESRRAPVMRLVGRLAPDKTVDDARVDLTTTATWLAATHPANRGRTVRVWAGAGMTSDERTEASRVPRLLTVAVGLLLLIACGNVATLSLIRVAARRRELATRVALGASRGRLVRQVVLEGSIVAVAAAALGTAIAVLMVRSATLVNAVIVMEDMDLAIDLRVLAVTLAASTMTAVLISVAPAMHAARIPPGTVLRDGGGAGRRRSPAQRLLVGLQVAASLVLLSAAATIFATFTRVLDTHATVDPARLTDMRVSTPPSVRETSERTAFFRALLTHVEAQPAVARATLTSTIPPFQWSRRVTVFRRGEAPSRATLTGRELELGTRVLMTDIADSFFDVMQIPVLRGRTFGPSDDHRSEPVVIINRRLADALWPGRDPIGQMVAWPSVEGPERPPLRVVGVVGNARDLSLSANQQPAMYVPFAQHPGGSLLLVVRSRPRQAVSAVDVRRFVAAVDPNAATLGGRTLLDRIVEQLRGQQHASIAIAGFGIIALVIASIGLYGVVAQCVLQRTREIAIRVALGATPRSILGIVLSDAARPAFYGALAGVVGSVASVPLLRSLFEGVRPGDSRLATLALVVLAVALIVAALFPARRATQLSPAVTLRTD